MRLAVLTVLSLDVFTLYTYFKLKNSNHDDSFIKNSRYFYTNQAEAEHKNVSSGQHSLILHGKKENEPITDELLDPTLVPPIGKLMLNTDLILYNRVPKCGSTTIINLMKACRRLMKERYEIFNDIEPNQAHYLPTLAERLDFVRNSVDISKKKPLIYLRHLHFINYTHYGESMPLYINIIRDPVEHFISNYYYLRHGFANAKNGANATKWNHSHVVDNDERDVTLEECINKQYKTCAKPYSDLIAFFCGNDSWCRKRDKRALAAAKENVKKYYLVVGVLERFDDTLTMFEKILAQYFKYIRIVYKRNQKTLLERSKTKNKSADPQQVRDYLAKHLAPEIELYKFVVDLMDTRLSVLKNLNTADIEL